MEVERTSYLSALLPPIGIKQTPSAHPAPQIDLHGMEHQASMSSPPSLRERKKSISSFVKNLFHRSDSEGADRDRATAVETSSQSAYAMGASQPSNKSHAPTSRQLRSSLSPLVVPANNNTLLGKSNNDAAVSISADGPGCEERGLASPSSRHSLKLGGPPPPPPPTRLTPSGSRTTPSRMASSSKSISACVLSGNCLAVNSVLPPKMGRAIWSWKDYAIVEKMYTGYASLVYKAWCKASGETVCLKAYNMGNLGELNKFQIYREIRLHSRLNHENVIKLFAAFEENGQVILVQEYAESGDLFNLLQKYGGKIPEKKTVEMILHPFLVVTNYLHQMGIVHRDIKPENVLFTRSMQLKLCDFGLAIDLREERAVTRAGTLEYMAPEVLNCPFKSRPEENKEKVDLQYSLTVDTWAMGVLAYELLVGFPPFNDKQRSAIEDKIRTSAPRFPTSMSDVAKNFILKALQKDALERPTIMELLAHPWIRTYCKPSAPLASRSNAQNASAGQGKKQQLQLKMLQQHQDGPVNGGGYGAEHQEDDDSDDDDNSGSYSGVGGGESPSGKTKGDSDHRLNKLDAMLHQVEMRTNDGDLLQKPTASFQSFTVGTNNRPKLGALGSASPVTISQTKHQAAGPVGTGEAATNHKPSPLSGGSSRISPPHGVSMASRLRNQLVGGAGVGTGGASGGSFSSAQNPRLQQLQGMMRKQ